MARYNPIKNSFVAGEQSPDMEARDDLDLYFQGARQIVNGIVKPTGGVMRRSGTRYVAEVKDSDDFVRLIPFEITDGAAYVVEFGVGYARFYTDEGRLESPATVPVEVTTPYTSSDDLNDLQFAQEADTMKVVHPNHQTYNLTRTSLTTFSFDKEVYRGGRAPLRTSNLDETITLTVTGSTLNWSADIGLDSASDVGRAVFVDDGTDIAWFEIDSVTAGDEAEATLKSGTAPALAEDNWALGASSDTEGFYAIAYHEGRLGLGGTDSAPDRFWLSVSDDFEDFDLSNEGDTDAQNASKSVTRRLVSNTGRINFIRWMDSEDKDLFIGTSGAEFRISGENNDIITPSGAKQRSSTARGSRHIQSVKVDTDLVFVQKTGRTLRNFGFNLVADNFRAVDFTVTSNHILRGGATRLAYQQDRNSVIWAVRADGVLVGFTFEADQQVNAAHRHIAGGSLEGGIAQIEDIATIPAPDLSHTQLWMVVKRTINGATKRYVEFLEDDFDPDVDSRSSEQERVDAMQDAFFVDSGLTYTGPSTTTITGLGHLEGETVDLLVNGGVHPQKVVTGGQVELERPSNDGTVHVGLPMPYRWETQRFVGGGQIGTDQGQKQRIREVSLRQLNSIGGLVGVGPNPSPKLERIRSRTPDHLMGDSPPVQSGDVRVPVEGGHTTEATVYFEQDQPVPSTTLGVMPSNKTNEKG